MNRKNARELSDTDLKALRQTCSKMARKCNLAMSKVDSPHILKDIRQHLQRAEEIQAPEGTVRELNLAYDLFQEYDSTTQKQALRVLFEGFDDWDDYLTDGDLAGWSRP